MSVMKEWDIWEADVPYSDKPKPYEYEIFKWQEAGLTAKSYIQCNKFISLTNDRFTGKKYGSLKMTDIVGIRQMMHYHGLIK